MGDNAKQKAANTKNVKALRDQKIWEEYELFCENEENWKWVVIPTLDLFDKPFGSISLNLINYGAGRHFLRPDVADELNRILSARYQADMRILRPTTDKKAIEIMARSGNPITVAGVGGDLKKVGPVMGMDGSAYPTESVAYPS